MTAVDQVVAALNHEYIRRYPEDAARDLAGLSLGEIVSILHKTPVDVALQLWQSLPLDVLEKAITRLEDRLALEVLSRSEPALSARLLLRLRAEHRTHYLEQLAKSKQHELSGLMQYPDDCAGGLMDPRFLVLREVTTVREARQLIRRHKPKFTRLLFLSDEQGKLGRMVEIQAIALAEGSQTLETLARRVPTAVLATASRDEVVEQLEKYKLTDLPVVDLDGVLLGVIRHEALIAAIQQEASVDIQTMVGVSRDERALSSIGFVVRKRLPWLQINLVTAFLAAAVVGVFESTIAQFTALAVLLPVVAGQSGNTGAQALAVTMRGLVLREIGASQWRRVARKEMGASFINGLAVALTTAAGVWVWSDSWGLALVITISMVISMMAAALAGVTIPIVLRSLGQDPAQSSSIILTTITDVVGFFSFLGIATLLSVLL